MKLVLMELSRFKNTYADVLWTRNLLPSTSGLTKRVGRYSGTIGDGGPFVKSFSLTNINKTYGQVLKRCPTAAFTGLNYDVALKLSANVPIDYQTIDGNIQLDSRIETFATWHESANEIFRIEYTIDVIQKNSSTFRDILDIMRVNRDDTIGAWSKYYVLLDNAQKPFSSWKRFANDKSDSSSPLFQGTWGSILDDDRMLQKYKSEEDGFINGMATNFDSIIKKDEPLYIRGDATVEALRARMAILSNVRIQGNTITAHCSKTTDRTAGGPKWLAQEGYALKFDHDMKNTVLRPVYDFLHKLVKDTLFWHEQGVLCYLAIAKAKNVLYADLTSGEVQFGIGLNFLGVSENVCGNVSGQAVPIGHKGCSGGGRTPECNCIVSCTVVYYLQSEFGINKQFVIGADNIAILEMTSEEWQEIIKSQEQTPALNGIKGFETMFGAVNISERFLGWREKRHFPLQLMHDSPAHNSGWNSIYRSYVGSRNKLSLNRAVQAVIMYDVVAPGSAVKLYEWVSKQPKIDNGLKDNHGSVLEWLEENVEVDSLKTVFPEAFEWVTKNLSTYDQNPDIDDWKWENS